GLIGREVVVGLVNDDNRAGRLVLDEPGDVRLGGHGTGGVVGVGDVVGTGRGVSREHRLDVVATGSGDGHAEDRGLHAGAGGCAGLVAGFTYDERLVGSDGCVEGEAERSAGAGEHRDI